MAYRTIGREEEARDIVQDTFLRAYRALPGFKGEAKFSSWLYRIALNLCRDWIRKQRRTPTVATPEGVDLIELALREGATAAGATVLEVRLHGFGAGQGVTGVALLAESHISIHSWPEHGYAAIDIFLCGARHNADDALAAIVDALNAKAVTKTLIERGYGLLQPA